jgi:hypothetical protein
MKTVRWTLAALLLGIPTLFPALAQNAGEKAIGLVSKVVLDVTRRAESPDWNAARRGDILDAGNTLRTGERSLAVVKLKDNSLLRVREQTVVTFSGTSGSGGFQKGAELQGGVVGFNITKQRPGEEFRFLSPTSVASIRGTDGSFTNADSADIFTILSGLGRITHRRTMESADVPAGFTAIAYENGALLVREATEEEKRDASNAAGLTGTNRLLRLELKNPKGETRELVIELNEQ